MIQRSMTDLSSNFIEWGRAAAISIERAGALGYTTITSPPKVAKWLQAAGQSMILIQAPDLDGYRGFIAGHLTATGPKPGTAPEYFTTRDTAGARTLTLETPGNTPGVLAIDEVIATRPGSRYLCVNPKTGYLILRAASPNPNTAAEDSLYIARGPISNTYLGVHLPKLGSVLLEAKDSADISGFTKVTKTGSSASVDIDLVSEAVGVDLSRRVDWRRTAYKVNSTMPYPGFSVVQGLVFAK